jgi:lipopolysaccharide export system permease protein
MLGVTVECPPEHFRRRPADDRSRRWAMGSGTNPTIRFERLEYPDPSFPTPMIDTHPGPSPRGQRPFFTVLDRMVSLEVVKTLCAILLVLVVIIVSRKFLNVLAKAIEGELSGDTIFQLLGLKILSATAILLPAASFMAILTVLGRMYRDQEMSALASAGVGMSRTYRALGWTLVPVCALSAVMSLEVMPWSEREAQALMTKDEKSADIRGFKPGRFNEFSQGDVVLYAEQLADDNAMHNVFVQSRQSNVVGIVISERGQLTKNELNEHFVVLNQGRRYQGVPGKPDFIISEFDEHGVRIDTAGGEAAELKREAEDTVELWRSRTPREMAELQKRLAAPLGVVFLSILAVPLARMAPRSGVYGNVFMAFLVYIVFENAQKVSQGLLMIEKIPLWLSYSGTYFLLLLITAGLLLRNLGLLWVRRAILERFGR